jgi:hypothetical protein
MQCCTDTTGLPNTPCCPNRTHAQILKGEPHLPQTPLTHNTTGPSALHYCASIVLHSNPPWVSVANSAEQQYPNRKTSTFCTVHELTRQQPLPSSSLPPAYCADTTHPSPLQGCHHPSNKPKHSTPWQEQHEGTQTGTVMHPAPHSLTKQTELATPWHTCSAAPAEGAIDARLAAAGD